MKLHQLLALLPTTKSKVNKAKTDIYQTIQKSDLFKGLSRTYSPREEDGYVYPSESKSVQFKADDLIRRFKDANEELINLCASQDFANCNAKANVVIDGVLVLENVPVSHLLFLEKQIEDIRTFVASLPTLDLDKEWVYSANRGLHASEPKQSVKTKKVTEFVVAYEATPQHAAQIKEVSKDTIEGVWTTIELSGALPCDTVRTYLERINKLYAAIVIARESANSIEVKEQQVADRIFGYIFGTIN